MKNIINLIVDKVEDNRRVDQFIADKEPTLSRTRIKNLIINSKLKINQKVIKDPSKKISISDSIILEIPEPKQLSLKPYKYNLDIIFEEARSILVNQVVNYSNIKNAFLLNAIYLFVGISLFYYSFSKARKKGTLINIGE